MIKHGLKYFKSIFVFVLCIFCFQIYCQETLQITYTRFGKFKKYEFFTRDVLEYKLKGKRIYTKQKIATMRDSIIVFDNDSVIKISNIKSIKLHKRVHLLNTISGFFIEAGVIYTTLNATNNLILGNPTIVNKKAIIIGTSLFFTGLIIRQFDIKRIHINKRKAIKVLDLKYVK